MHSIDLLIRNKANPGTYTASAITLPIPGTGLTSASKSFSSSQTGGGAISATATTGYGWILASGNRTGYGYNSNQGNTYITYTILWTPPSNWPTGSYDVMTYVYGDAAKTKRWSGTSGTFTLSSRVVLTPILGLDGAFILEPGVVDVAEVVTNTGKFKLDVEIKSADGKVGLSIDEGTFGLIKNGDPITKITVLEMADPPAPPADASIIGLAYDLGPGGATFDPPITLIFTYESGDIPEGIDEEDLVIAIWDEDSGEWVVFEGATVDPVTGTLSVLVSHFTEFAIFARVTPEPEVPVAEPEEPALEPKCLKSQRWVFPGGFGA